MLQPKEIKVKSQDGKELTFIISKFPATAGREIVTQYPISAMPKIGDYKVNEEIMLKLMKYVSIKIGDTEQALSNRDLIDNHVPDWEVLSKIEIEMMSYNCSFFEKGKISNFLDNLKANMKQLISSTLTDSLARLYQASKQR